MVDRQNNSHSPHWPKGNSNLPHLGIVHSIRMFDMGMVREATVAAAEMVLADWQSNNHLLRWPKGNSNLHHLGIVHSIHMIDMGMVQEATD